ncbi:transglutaminase-like domain-containing protein [Streptomyces sp. NPDC054784]
MTNDNRERFRREATGERPDLALLCLLIGNERDAGARGPGCPDAATPGGEAAIDAAQIELDRLAGELPAGLPPDAPQAWAEALRRLLGERYGFHGTPADYRRLDSSLLQAVLGRRRGLPILLSVVWLEVARRAGARVYGVALPGHFVVAFGDPDGEHVLADPYAGGRTLSAPDVDLLVAHATGERRSVPRALLRPADPLETVLRVLNNIRAWAAARPEHSDVRLWALELALLLPHHPLRLRLEQAQLLVERADFVAGARALEEYADLVAAMEPSSAESVRREARAARARLN